MKLENLKKKKFRVLRRERLLKAGTYHIDKLPHNYDIEKQIVTELIKKGKIAYLTDY